MGATLKDVSYSVKQNGIMVNLDYTEPIDDDDRIRRLSSGESQNKGDMKSVLASKSTSDTVWPWFEQDTKSQCKGTIDFLCSNAGMTMNYNKAYDIESN